MNDTSGDHYFGYTCPVCGVWVPPRWGHVCRLNPYPVYPAQPPMFVNPDLIERLVSVLERLEKKLNA